jgi:hypothetical protein
MTTSAGVSSALALAVLLLGGLAAWQSIRISAVTSELQQARRDVQFSAERVAFERLQGRGDEMARAVSWLDELYRSPDGLQRPDGLWLADQRRVDGEAIAVWILDVYLPARVGGASEEEARRLVLNRIQSTDEWRRRHPGA